MKKLGYKELKQKAGISNRNKGLLAPQTLLAIMGNKVIL